MVLVYGFAGLRDFGGRLCFAPWLPPQLDQIKFKLRVRGCELEVCIAEDRASYRLIGGHRLTIFHEQEEILLSADAPSVCRDLTHIAKQDLPNEDA
jgi:alpha,alpha-trehalose phosphorylase